MSTKKNIVVPNYAFVTKFADFENSTFCLDKRFIVRTNDNSEFVVTINERALYFELFENPIVIDQIGREASIVLDFSLLVSIGQGTIGRQT